MYILPTYSGHLSLAVDAIHGRTMSFTDGHVQYGWLNGQFMVKGARTPSDGTGTC